MFEFLFPIFCFGLVVTGIVAKGLLTAADFAEAQKRLDGSVNAESGEPRISNRSPSSSHGPMSPNPIDSAKASITTPSAEWFQPQN
jgi:hypothetical protein